MNKNYGLLISSGLLTVLAICIGFFQSYLLYKHVQATELMWFLWVINMPLTISLHIVAGALKNK